MIRPIRITQQNKNNKDVNFSSHKCVIKTLWKKGALPSVTKGIYGGDLTVDNFTMEHIEPISKGGKSTLSNYAVATAENNMKRSSKDITQFLTEKGIVDYLMQFLDINKKGFDGNSYILMLIKTFKKYGYDLSNLEKIVKGR